MYALFAAFSATMAYSFLLDLPLSADGAHYFASMLERERFDLLHFHEPFVPFLSLVLLRESQSINVATFHAYAGWSPAYEFGKRMLGRFARGQDRSPVAPRGAPAYCGGAQDRS